MHCVLGNIRLASLHFDLNQLDGFVAGYFHLICNKYTIQFYIRLLRTTLRYLTC